MVSNRTPERLGRSNKKNQDRSQAVAESGNLVCVEPEVAELADRYIKLVCFLDELNQKLDTTENPLEICLDALVAVKRFVDVHPTVAQKGITRPLGMLATSILDLTLGSAPELLKPNPNITGRPKSVSGKVTLQATGAACAEILISYGFSVEKACSHVLKALEKEKQANAGGSKPITWQTIKRWRDEMGGRNSDKSIKIYTGLQTELKKALGSNPSIKEREDAVANCIQGLISTGATGHRPKRKKI